MLILQLFLCIGSVCVREKNYIFVKKKHLWNDYNVNMIV